jgi:hypothetical protein
LSAVHCRAPESGLRLNVDSEHFVAAEVRRRICVLEAALQVGATRRFQLPLGVQVSDLLPT